MKGPQRCIEWGALRLELKRMFKRGAYKYQARGMEWSAPVARSVCCALLSGILALFLGIFLYRDMPGMLYFVMVGAIIIANKAWKIRNPLLMDPWARFVDACSFSRLTWYRASLVAGLLVTMIYGLILAALTVWMLTGDAPEYRPVDDALFVKVGCLPMAAALFYLLHFEWERSRRLRKVLDEPVGRYGKYLFKLRRHVPALPFHDLILIWPFCFVMFFCYFQIYWTLFFGVLLAATLLDLFRCFGRKNTLYLYPLLLGVFWIFYDCLVVQSFDLFFGLADVLNMRIAAAAVVLLFLIAAWRDFAFKRDRFAPDQGYLEPFQEAS